MSNRNFYDTDIAHDFIIATVVGICDKCMILEMEATF